MKRPAKRSRYECAYAAFDLLAAKLAAIPGPTAEAVCASWEDAKQKHAKMLGDPASRVTRSMLTAGMEQGLRELPMLLRGLPEPSRRLAIGAYNQALQSEHPTLLQADQHRLAKTKARGIRTEPEYYLVRHHVDLLEGVPARQTELSDLLRLIDEYEARRPRRVRSA